MIHGMIKNQSSPSVNTDTYSGTPSASSPQSERQVLHHQVPDNPSLLHHSGCFKRLQRQQGQKHLRHLPLTAPTTTCEGGTFLGYFCSLSYDRISSACLWYFRSHCKNNCCLLRHLLLHNHRKHASKHLVWELILHSNRWSLH